MSVIDLLLIVVAVSENAAQERVRIRVAGVKRGGSIGAKVISSSGIKSGINAHVARHPLEVETRLQIVAAFRYVQSCQVKMCQCQYYWQLLSKRELLFPLEFLLTHQL